MKRFICILISAAVMVSAMPGITVSAAKLSISRTSASLPVNYYAALTVKGAKSKVKWTSENKKIVSVKSVTDNTADIIGIGEGTAYVYAEADGRTVKCKVTVKKTFIDVSSKSIELSPDGTRNIKLAATGQRRFAVKVSDKSVCSVSWGKWKNGKLTLTVSAKSKGTAKIGIYPPDGGETPLKTITVTVKDTAIDESGTEKAVSVIKYVKPLSERAEDVYKRLCKEMKGIIADYPYECAVYLYNTEKGRAFGHNRTKTYPGASTVKLPYVYYCCTRIEAGEHSMDEKVTYLEKHHTGGQGSIQYTAYGSQWTIRQLMELALGQSDNVAYYMLLDVFGKEGFNSMVKEWGYSERIDVYNYPDLSPEFLCEAIMKFRSKAFSSKGHIYGRLWNILETESSSYVRGAANKSNTAVKYGMTRGFYNEVCYIDSKSPYVLVIMSRTNNGEEKLDGDREFFRAVAKMADKINTAFMAVDG